MTKAISMDVLLSPWVDCPSLSSVLVSELELVLLLAVGYLRLGLFRFTIVVVVITRIVVIGCDFGLLGLPERYTGHHRLLKSNDGLGLCGQLIPEVFKVEQV